MAGPVLVPPKVSLPAAAAEDPRLGHLLGRDLRHGEAPRAVIVGFPVDEGVRRNGGRPGAAEGPAALRGALYRMTPDAFGDGSHARLLGRTRDLGDLAPSGDLESDQEALGALLAGPLREGSFALVLGGGHETAYGHFLGHVAAGLSPEILNLDAHADVRETRGGLGHSGSPFRQALLHPSGRCRRYRVAGLAAWSLAGAHLDLVRARGGEGIAAAGLDEAGLEALFAGLAAPAIASFDLDALDQAFAPGVSSPAPCGLAPGPWLRAAFLAGRSAAVASADVCELCPAHDEGGRTARIAALTAWHILRGLAARG